MIDCQTPQDFQNITNVSRETLDKLTLYGELLAKWQASINLVSKNTLNAMWQRHFLDSAQLAPLIHEFGSDRAICVDMGAGAGFPGLVLAAMGAGHWTLVESDTRKCVFLNEVVRQCEISATIRNERVEGITDLQADIVTGRAFASLDQLLAYAAGVSKPAATHIYPKGQRADEELAIARQTWRFDVEERDSMTDDNGKILIIQGVARA